MKASATPSINFSGTGKMAFLREHKNLIMNIICLLLISMWTYAALSKLIDIEKSRAQMLNQVFPVRIAVVLVWAVPAIELMTVALLAFEKSLKAGLALSAVLMAGFSMYIAVVMTGIFGRVPCSCGGIIEKLSYGEHFIFNLVFLLLSIAGYLISRGERPISTIPPGNQSF